MAGYTKTPARMAALKRAQAASAAKRKGRGKGPISVSRRRAGKIARAKVGVASHFRRNASKYRTVGSMAAGAAMAYTAHGLNGKKTQIRPKMAVKKPGVPKVSVKKPGK